MILGCIDKIYSTHDTQQLSCRRTADYCYVDAESEEWYKRTRIFALSRRFEYNVSL